MREFILIAALCLIVAFIADLFWLKGKIFGTKHVDYIASFVIQK